MTTTTTDYTPFTSIRAFQAARDLCLGAVENSEYVRGCAEVLIDSHPGLTMDDKDALIEWLVNEDAPVPHLKVTVRPVDGYHFSYDYSSGTRAVRNIVACAGSEPVAHLDPISAQTLLPILAEWVSKGRIQP